MDINQEVSMHRRDFFKIGGASFAAFSLLAPLKTGPGQHDPEYEGQPSTTWITGSPYLGHSDYRKSFRNLSFDEIQRELIHFRTEEPWRTRKLFGV
jgi:hypothetical protein